jgi:hypothetical protein
MLNTLHKYTLPIVCLALMIAGLISGGCGKKTSPAKPAKPKPPQIVIFPGLPQYPGSTLVEGTKDEERAVYTTAAEPEAVFTYYKTELETRNPVKPRDEEFRTEKRRRCTRRWNVFEKPEGLFIVKGRRALLVNVAEGRIVFERKEADRVWAAVAQLSDRDYLKIVLRFAQRLHTFEGTPEERVAFIEEGGLKLGASLERLRQLTPIHSLALIVYLNEHPEFKEKGIPAFLKDLEFWESLEASTGPDCEDPLEITPEELAAFKKNWSI